MTKLYEVIAIEGDHQGRAQKLIQETISTLSNKPNLFQGKAKNLKLFSRENVVEAEAAEKKDSTFQKLETTVPETLNYTLNVVANYWDLMFQKESANATASADLVLDGVVIAEKLPAAFLLSVENRLKELRTVFDAIPTLAPGIDWKPDTSVGAHIVRSPETIDLKTQEITDYKTIAPATDKHPAQVVPMKMTSNIGTYSNITWSGMISSAQKAELLQKIDKLQGAVKTARMRANDCEIQKRKVADKLMTVLVGDWFKQ